MSTPSAANDGYRWKKLGYAAAPPIPSDSNPDAPDPAHEARERGFDEGYEEGKARAAAEQKAQFDALRQVLEELTRLRSQAAVDATRDAARALHTLFKQVFRYELRASAELLQALIDELAERLHADCLPQIELNPADHAVLQELVPEEVRKILGADDAVAPGVIRAGYGRALMELDAVANLEQVLSAAVANLELATPGQSHERLRDEGTADEH